MLRRFWVEPEQINGDSVHFEGDSFHHLIRVSRKKIGDEVEVLDGRGLAFVVRITAVDKAAASGVVIGQRELPALKRPLVNLGFCFPKPANFEIVLEKAVELGCHSVTPLINEYAFVSKKRDFPENRRARWEKIIKSATEQSGRANLMQVNPVADLTEFLESINRKSTAKGLFLYEGDCPFDLRQYLSQQNFNQVDEVWAIVGSEGGFSAEEVTLLNAKGFTPLSLGKQILRTETACVSILSILQYHLGHLS